MSRDGYERWDDRRDDGYESQGGGRRGRRARTDEQWPADSQPQDPYQSSGSHRRSSGQHGYTDPGYADPGYGDGDYRDRGYPGGDTGQGYGGQGYQDAGYGGQGYQDAGYGGSDYSGSGYGDDRYADAGYSDHGQTGPGNPSPPDGYGQPDGYGHSGGYARPGSYPDQSYPYQDGAYPPSGYRDGQDGHESDSYGGRPGYGEQDHYRGPGGYDTGDPYAAARDRRGANQADYEGLAGPQYGHGFDDHGFDADPNYGGRGADRGGSYGWRDSPEDSGVTRRRQRDPEDDFDPDSARHNGFFRGFGAPDDAVGHRPPKKKKKRRSGAGTVALLILIIFLGGIVGGGYYAYHWYSKRHADWTGSAGHGTVEVRVMPGEIACSAAMENTLVSDGVVASASAFCNAAKANATGRVLEPGTFRLHKHMGAALAWALLLDPKSRVNNTVAVPDGLRYSKVIALLAAKTNIPVAQFESALHNKALGLPSWAKGNPEGFLWPATYNVEPGATALSILQMLVKQATTEYASLNLAAKAKTAGFTEYQVIVEASLLEGEVPPKYYGKVARVIDNRLNQSMKLQLDSTVAYALNKYVYNLSASDLNTNSLYNTFLHLDLPPGPIDSPDVAAIMAVLHPTATSALYFITVNKQGLTEFTSDPNQFAIWSAQAKKNGV